MGGLALDPAVAWVLRGAAALLWLSVSLHKLRDLGAFERAVAGYALLPAVAVRPFARCLAGFELALGLGCLVPGAAIIALPAGATVLALYTVAVLANLARGRRGVDCGCGGPGGPQPLSAGLVVRNLALVVLMLVASLPASGRALHWIDAVTIGAGVAWLALVHAGVDVLLAHAVRGRTEGELSWSRP
jgi:hypothetical protein